MKKNIPIIDFHSRNIGRDTCIGNDREPDTRWVEDVDVKETRNNINQVLVLQMTFTPNHLTQFV